MGLLDTAKHIFKRKTAKKEKVNPTVVKKHSSLNLQIESRITIDLMHLLGFNEKSFFQKPEHHMVISAVGQMQIADSDVYRFYLENADGESDVNRWILQIVEDANGDVEECRLFHEHTVVYPGDSRGWGEYLDENTGKIGTLIFIYDRLEHKLEYERMWSDSDDGWIPPLEMTEAYTNSKGIVKLIPHESMMYGTWLNEEHEIAQYILLSSTTDEGDFISYWIGVDVPVPAITKVY